MHQLELVIPHPEAASVRPMAVLVNCAIERLANEHHMEAAELVAGSPLEGGRWRRVCLGFAMRSSGFKNSNRGVDVASVQKWDQKVRRPRRRVEHMVAFWFWVCTMCFLQIG